MIRRSCNRWLMAAGFFLVPLLACVARGQTAAQDEAFHEDLRALASGPHRLSGTREAQEAADYVRKRLTEMGAQVLTLDMPVWQTKTVRCELLIDGQTIPLLPLRPDLVIAPNTPPGGLSGPIIYVGEGRPEDYGKREARDAIVVLDYASYGNWKSAFAMGAKAVLLLGDARATNPAALHAVVPANLVRLYVPPASQTRVDLRRDHPQATVVSQVVWELGTGVNVLGYLAGTAPGFVATRAQPEMLALAASLDSFGTVPEASPAARLAANTAALLAAGEYLVEHRPRRDVLLMFLDNRARYLQGARYVYDALMLSDEGAGQVRQNHRDEFGFLNQLWGVLDTPEQRLMGSTAHVDAVLKLLDQQAFRLRSQIDARYQEARLRMQSLPREQQGELSEGTRKLAEERSGWDQVRRLLNRARQSFDRRGAEDIDPQYYKPVKAAALAAIKVRLAELQGLMRTDEQREELRQAIGPRSIVLHVEYDFADQSRSWSFVAGQALRSVYGFAATRRGANDDKPGRHNWLLRALGQAAEGVGQPLQLTTEPLEDPEKGLAFAGSELVPNGFAAGAYGIYNVSAVTGNDGRPREGHPSDTVQNLDWAVLAEQARQATLVLKAAADSEGLSLPRQFTNRGTSARPRWSSTSVSGNVAVLKATGSLVDDWPATGALVAALPSANWWETGNQWYPIHGTGSIRGFDPYILEPVDANGRFSLIGVSPDDFENFAALGVLFDEAGEAVAINSTDTLYCKAIDGAKLELFPCRGFSVVAGMTASGSADDLVQILGAASNAEVRTSRSNVVTDQGVIAFYLHQYDLQAGASSRRQARFKLYQPNGPLVLNIQPQFPYGEGLPIQQFGGSLPVDRLTAEDRWKVDELRLGTLRQRGVILGDLERLHRRAGRVIERLDQEPTTLDRQAQLSVALSLSNRVYTPLRQAMNDLINGVVLLLLLAIPFAFSLERLLVCSTTVYGRVTGFAACFMVSFVLLYLMHPGFAVANTPVMILLAFTIILLSSLVCFIIVRKFRNELMQIQGQASAHHQVEISRMGTLLAAVGMGMSTMRRRPLRTVLTAITVVMLTFTILIFASFSSEWGVRMVYQGPLDDTQAATVLTHKLDYGALAASLPMKAVAPAGSYVAEQYWRIREPGADRQFTVARADDGRNLKIQAVMGLDPQELPLWPALAEVIEGRDLPDKQERLGAGGVYLPHVVMDQLGLGVGDRVLVDGRAAKVTGALDEGALLRLRHLDGRSVLPVDYQVMEQERARREQLGAAAQQLNDERVQRDFQRVDASEIVIGSSDFVKQLGGSIHVVTLYTPPGEPQAELGQDVARVLDLPVWARAGDGTYRLFFTQLPSISGGMALLVPVVLGGLIIFGTMLGSITDREKEIYTFSALGLGPAHVGFLFFAEAAVYAVVGGMGGQLLAQGVALATQEMSQRGWIHPAQLNFSSTNSLFAIGIVMATVLVSAIYPAIRASRSANPGLARSWKMPKPREDELSATFPFTVSSYDITGVVSFLAEHFRQHDDAGLGLFACTQAAIRRSPQDGGLSLEAQLALAPFDLGVTQSFTLAAMPSEIPGVDEVRIQARRISGAKADWYRANRVFIQDLRRQFLLWRTLTTKTIESYRQQTLAALAGGEQALSRRSGETDGISKGTIDSEVRA